MISQIPATPDLSVDALVIGGGMSGLTAAASLAESGASVLVVEKSAETGGSAALALGFFWTVRNAEVLKERNPGADPTLGELLMSEYDNSLAWIRKKGVEVRDRLDLDSVMGFPSIGHLFDNIGYLRKCERSVAAHGGHVMTGSVVEGLLVDNGTVTGASVSDGETTVTVRARSTILATGGFQGNPDLRRTHIGTDADRILLRANPHSTGDGLSMATDVGASVSSAMSGFYGHLVPSPLTDGLEPADYARLSMMFSPRCILLDPDGHRWMDESRGYFVNAQEVARLPGQRALLIGDQTVRGGDGLSFGNSEQSDRIDTAIARGARATVHGSLADLALQVAEWGYPDVTDAVEEYNAALSAGTGPTVPRRGFHRPLTDGPFFAVEVQPTITFTHGGVRTDPAGHVLRADGSAVDGLLAAGVDVGGMFDGGYGGGLAMATVTGLAAARTALERI